MKPDIEQTIMNKQKVMIQMKSQEDFEKMRHDNIMEEIREMGKFNITAFRR